MQTDFAVARYNPEDTTPPGTSISSGPSGLVNTSSAQFEFSSTEAGSTFECSLDGAAYSTCSSPKDYTNLNGGDHTFEVKATDPAGNTDSTPASRTWTVDVIQAPVQNLVMGSTLGVSTVPVKLSWSATDVGTGVASYQLQQSVNGGAYSYVPLPSAMTTTLTLSLDPANSYQYQVQAQDEAGNNSAWATGPSFTVDLRQETYRSAVTYSGTWTSQASSTASGGYTKYAKASGAKAKFSFAGRSVAWVAPTGPNRGKAAVWVDGVKSATVDLYSSTAQAQKMVFTKSWSTSKSHTLEIRALGTKRSASTGTRVDVDAFVALR